jgi:serine protease Do
VAQVDEGTPAEKAGLAVGDVITGFNGINVKDAQQFRFLVADAGPGTEANLEIIRDGKKKGLQVRLGDRAEILGRTSGRPGERGETEDWLGLEVETLSRRHTERFNIEVEKGAVIVSVEPGSPADDAGLVPGDVILKIAGTDIEDAGDFYKIAGDLKDVTKPISFYIKRGNAYIFVAVTPE